jgi:hypothetical protein
VADQLVDPAEFPLSRQRTIGRLVKELEALVGSFPGDKAVSMRQWL